MGASAALLEILALDKPADEDDVGFYLSFVDLLYSVFHGPCRDLNELRHVAALLFPKYREPVLKQQGPSRRRPPTARPL